MIGCLCFISSIYLTGALGVQNHPIDAPMYENSGETYTNTMGRYLGEVRLVVEFTNNMYIEAKHVSGLNVAEHDNGLNALMVGVKINFKGGN